MASVSHSVVEELRENDPAKTDITIFLYDETSDAVLAQALEQNPFVTDIDLYLDGVEHTDWDSLLHVIATRAKLDEVTLQDAYRTELRNAPTALVRSILRAIQQNTAIRTVKFKYVRLTTDISTFVNTVSSITAVAFEKCDMEPGEREHGARDLAAAFQRNAYIESLDLWKLDDLYAIPILEGLRLNTAVKTLIFSPEQAHFGATSHAIQSLLESTTSIQTCRFKDANFSAAMFRPIAQAITDSECVSELSFTSVGFQETVQLRSILLNKQNLTALCLSYCNFGRGQVHGDIISMLLRPNSLLRCFEFWSFSLKTELQFDTLLRAIEQSRLERFKIGFITTLQQLQTLTRSIPSMKLKELEVDFWDDEGRDNEDEAEDEFDQESIRQDLFQAVKNNFSLRAVKADICTAANGSYDLYERAEDKRRLAFYANRNARLEQWVDNPEEVEQQNVWPEALGLAQRAGPDALFRGLRSVVESDFIGLPGGRKRKRPQFDAPS